MSILVMTTIKGMDTATYDEVSSHLTNPIKATPGFVIHVGYEADGGITVGEVWQSRAQYDAWFEESVKPNVQGEMSTRVIELHRVVQP
jgi:hypothetical protein